MTKRGRSGATTTASWATGTRTTARFPQRCRASRAWGWSAWPAGCTTRWVVVVVDESVGGMVRGSDEEKGGIHKRWLRARWRAGYATRGWCWCDMFLSFFSLSPCLSLSSLPLTVNVRHLGAASRAVGVRVKGVACPEICQVHHLLLPLPTRCRIMIAMLRKSTRAQGRRRKKEKARRGQPERTSETTPAVVAVARVRFYSFPGMGVTSL